MTAAPLRLVFDPAGDDLAAAKECEADVFLERYGNTREEFALEYGPYDDQTGFIAVLEGDGRAVAAARFIAAGPAGLKTLNDVSRPPWHVDGEQSARSAGVDIDRTWDVATIAARRGEGRGGLCAAALYYGLNSGASANGIDFIVTILDSHARDLLASLSMRADALPGTSTGEYLGSASSTPLWSDVRRVAEQQREENPDAYRLIYQGIGLDGIALPTDWVWHRRGITEGSARR
jgi:hypothetical protein